MRTKDVPQEIFESLIVATASVWHDLEISRLDLESLASAYQNWQSILAASSASVPFDATPGDFIRALRAESIACAVFVTQPDDLEPLRIQDVSNDSILELNLTEIRRFLQTGELSSVELTKTALLRLHKIHDQTNACVAIETERALKQALACDARIHSLAALGVLHGIPLAHKDLFYQTDVVDAGCCGVKPRSVRIDSGTGRSVVLDALDQAGAVNLGRLHMTEFAFDPSGLNSELGACRNPWDFNCVPGGSSSGSAVVVASRAVFGALGSDTGGSIRIPASLCGVTGLKPTFGLVSTQGAMPLSHSNDHIGPIARSAADCALLMQVITDAEAVDPSTYSHLQKNFERVGNGGIYDLSGLKIGVPVTFFQNGLIPEIKTVMDTSLAKFQDCGATIHDVPDGEWEKLNVLGAVITRVEAAARVARLRMLGGINPAVLARFEQGIAIPGSLYVQALNERGHQLRAFLASVMKDVDVLHLPVCRIHTPTISSIEAGGSQAAYLRSELTILNRCFNYLGLPALSLPGGFCSAKDGVKMPVGIQLVGKPYSDAQLLAVGAAWQRQTSWHRCAPIL